MIKIPNDNKQIVQTNTSDTLGSFWSSQGVDLTNNSGRIRAGYRMVKNISDADSANLGCPVGFKYLSTDSAHIWTVAGSYVFKNSGLPSDAFSQDASTGTPTNCSSDISDIEVFGATGELYVTTASNTVYYITSTTWSNFNAGGSDATSPHLLCQYGNRMYMTRALSQIVSWDSSHTVATVGSQYALQLGSSESNVITFIKASASRIWIGTVNTTGGKGYVYEWDGASAQVTKSYRLQSAGAVSCVIKDDIPYIMDVYGSMYAWNGGNFQLIARIKSDPRIFTNALSQKNDRFIHPNGMMVTQGQYINVLINNLISLNGNPINERVPSGIWEYTQNTGLYCKHGFGTAKSGDTIQDYINVRISRAGGLAEINMPSTNSGRNGTFLAGADFYTDASTTAHGIFYDDQNDSLQKYAYFITQKLESTQVIDEYIKAFAKYKKLLNSSDKIILKYRQAEVDPVEAAITWTSTTTFTVLNSAVDVSKYWTANTGDEVEILRGIGAGKTAHITNAVNNAGTWTVTVDETFTGASSQTATARFQHWTKHLTVNDQTSFYKELGLGIGKKANWTQFKACLQFTGGNEIEQLIAQTSPAVYGDVVNPKLLKL